MAFGGKVGTNKGAQKIRVFGALWALTQILIIVLLLSSRFENRHRGKKMCASKL
jgi:hypothetical protein